MKRRTCYILIFTLVFLTVGCTWEPIPDESISYEITIPREEYPTETTASGVLPEIEIITEDEKLPDSFVIAGFKPMSQLPELPSGCEATALAQTLEYLGYKADKTVIADKYLPKVYYGDGDFIDEFVGDPFSEFGYGCFAPAIVAAAKNYLADNGNLHKPVDISGSSPDEIYRYVSKGTPVIVWATGGMIEPYSQKVWNLDGEEIFFMVGEHCMTIIGYDYANNTVAVADPQKGLIQTFSMELFEKRYSEMGSYAVVILPS